MRKLILTLALITFAATAAQAGGDSNFLGTLRIMKQRQIQQQKAAGDLKTDPGTRVQQTDPAGPLVPTWDGYVPDNSRH